MSNATRQHAVPAIKTVLIVDDDRGTLDTFGFVLRQAGYDVSLAETGHFALDLVRRKNPDIVVCDLRLPDLTALDVARELRQMGIPVPFVVVTGLGDVSSALEAGKLGVAEYLEKPLTSEHLLEAVHRIAGSAGKTNTHVARAQHVIEERHGDPRLTMRAVASAVGVSRQHLGRVLKQELGFTFADLLRKVRVREAQQLLCDASRSIKEIAFRVGFRRPSQFARAFRDDCGISPSEYRNRSLNPRSLIASECADAVSVPPPHSD